MMLLLLVDGSGEVVEVIVVVGVVVEEVVSVEDIVEVIVVVGVVVAVDVNVVVIVEVLVVVQIRVTNGTSFARVISPTIRPIPLALVPETHLAASHSINAGFVDA
jgi:hypothetical protein